MRSRASVALVSVFAHRGFLVMISSMVTFCAFFPPPTTRNAKSFAVKIPATWSSSSVTKTQSSLLAAMSCAASATDVEAEIWSAGLGFRARTVPGGALRVGRTRPAGFFFLFRSVSILRRMAYGVGGEQLSQDRRCGDDAYLVPLGHFGAAGAERRGGIAVGDVGGVGVEGWTGDARGAFRRKLGSCRLVAVFRGSAHGACV